jgi:protein phosphatase
VPVVARADATTDLFEVAVLSHPGQLRENNEDHAATFTADDCVGLIVADGVSGFEGGEVASQTAVAVTLETFLRQAQSVALDKRLYRAVQRANQAVYDKAVVVPELRSMATTLTAVLLCEHGLYAAHVGDCRLYRVTSSEIVQLTKDHTVAGERARLGLLSKARARTHPDRSVLTRNLGRELIAAVDQLSAPLSSGDVLVVCSDGLHGVLDDDEIAALSREGSPSDACAALVERANALGAPDNVTVSIARVVGEPAAPRPSLIASLLGRFGAGRG